MKYVGRGFIPGVPARDLTEEEVERFGAKMLEDSGLYEKARTSGRSKKKDDLPQTMVKNNDGGEE